jgi:radical SAM-linked protein
LPRIDFGPALPVGVESLMEFFDFECFGHLRPEEVEARLKEVLPTGIELLQCVEVPIDVPSLFTQTMLVRYRIRIPASFGGLRGDAGERIQRFLASSQWKVARWKDGKRQDWDVRPLVRSARWVSEDTLQVDVLFRGDRGVRLLELLGALLGLEEGAVRALEILKEDVQPLEERELLQEP